MKLLFDHNLSPKLVKALEDLFPGSDHVYPLGMDQAEDTEIWEFAKDRNFVLVTRDADFGDLSVLRGFPPNVVWIRRGNCKTKDIEKILRQNSDIINLLEVDELVGMIPLF
ncbi:MAG: DUF5615 family PIN-like protein [Pyrinomonadaceae bacterium]|nr:DUF5615 family PIN-like protein [Pyrinomonadaceae bacterium]